MFMLIIYFICLYIIYFQLKIKNKKALFKAASVGIFRPKYREAKPKLGKRKAAGIEQNLLKRKI